MIFRRQGRIKGGGALWASVRGPALLGGPADFLGLAVYGAMFFGTAPHGLSGHIIYVAGRWSLAF